MKDTFAYFENHKKNGSLNELINQIQFYNENEKCRYSDFHDRLMQYIESNTDDETRDYLYKHIKKLFSKEG